jgi:hypothetical protein
MPVITWVSANEMRKDTGAGTVFPNEFAALVAVTADEVPVYNAGCALIRRFPPTNFFLRGDDPETIADELDEIDDQDLAAYGVRMLGQSPRFWRAFQDRYRRVYDRLLAIYEREALTPLVVWRTSASVMDEGVLTLEPRPLGVRFKEAGYSTDPVLYPDGRILTMPSSDWWVE